MPVGTKQGKLLQGGKSLRLEANYLELKTSGDYKFYQYVVKFEPENDSMRIRKRWFHEAIAINHPNVGFIYSKYVQSSENKSTKFTIISQTVIKCFSLVIKLWLLH
jgi:hypothetical protein